MAAEKTLRERFEERKMSQIMTQYELNKAHYNKKTPLIRQAYPGKSIAVYVEKMEGEFIIGAWEEKGLRNQFFLALLQENPFSAKSAYFPDLVRVFSKDEEPIAKLFAPTIP